ncbi:MAG: CoA-binding protein [Chloroflexota bacterium]|nr:MAG: CoA-binding protein [Chloroflexota bacterium]
MSPDQVKQILLDTKTIAVVGISTRAEQTSHAVAQYMQAHGYKIIPVNPRAQEILGEKAYPNLTAIPREIQIDTALLFLRSEDVPPVAQAAIALGVKALWMQEGVRNEQAAARAEKAGLLVIQDRCMRAAHRFFFAEPKK